MFLLILVPEWYLNMSRTIIISFFFREYRLNQNNLQCGFCSEGVWKTTQRDQSNFATILSGSTTTP